MGCFYPLHGWKSHTATENGKRPVVFRRQEGYQELHVTLPCGKCDGCKLERARQWAIRAEHEASLHDDNVFVTLTYDKEPDGGSLRKRDFVTFMKRLRKEKGNGIRFMQAGEYGALGRPHHHILLFNCAFQDGLFLKLSPSGEPLYQSKQLERIWTHGFAPYGAVTFESAGYVARYNIKTLTHKELNGREPEYMTMSRNPGIGAKWIEKYTSDVYPSDEMVIRGGHVTRPPRYYDSLVERWDPNLMRQVKAQRLAKERDPKEQADNRMRSKEIICKQRLNDQLKRDQT